MDISLRQPKVSIIILNYNGLNDTIECLGSVKKIDYPNYEIIVVDNCSTDGSVEEIKKLFPGVILIENKENLGFSGGNNVGIRYALKNGADYIFLLNNDTVVDQKILNVLIATTKHQEHIGALGCKIFYYKKPNLLQHTGGIITNSPILSAFHRGDREIDHNQYDEITEVDYITGAAIFLSRFTIEKIGLFDERFFFYWEDTDFCLRIKKAGLRNLYVPTAKVWHKVAASIDPTSPRVCYYSSRNRLLFAKKHGFIKDRFPKEIISWVIYDIKGLFKRRYYLRITAIVAIIYGAIDFLRNKFGKCPGFLCVKNEKLLESQLRKYLALHIHIKNTLQALRLFLRKRDSLKNS